MKRTGVIRVTGEASVGRGGTRRARRLATREALLSAVWQVSQRWLEPADQTPGLRVRLGRRVRSLVKWYRTRRRGRQGRAYHVVIDVIVDREALRARLVRVGAVLHPPGVAVALRCGGGRAAVAGLDVTPWLRKAGVRVVEPASAPVLLEVACRVSPPIGLGGSTATGVLRRVARAQVTVEGALRISGRSGALLWRGAATAAGVGSDAGRARQDGAKRAMGAFGRALVRALTARLPRGVGRGVWLRLGGGAPLGVQLAFGRRLARELPVVWRASPARVGRGETWFHLVATSGARAVGRALEGLAPPKGWSLSVTALADRARPPRHDVVDVELKIAEETP